MLQGSPCDEGGRQGKLSLAAVCRDRKLFARRAVAMDRQQVEVNLIQSWDRQKRGGGEYSTRKACWS
jgi:hypothetical protein